MFIRYCGKIYYTEGFKPCTCDWNCDGDVYTAIVAKCIAAGGDCLIVDNYADYEIIHHTTAIAETRAELEKYFEVTECGCIDPTRGGENHFPFHYSGGAIVQWTEKERQTAIETEFSRATENWNI